MITITLKIDQEKWHKPWVLHWVEGDRSAMADTFHDVPKTYEVLLNLAMRERPGDALV